MVRARVIISRGLYWLGLVVIAIGIALIIDGARLAPAPNTGPPQVWVGFLVGLLGMALTARGATMKRY